MSLIDRVLSWDDNELQCESRRHFNRENPLAEQGHLGTACLLEYGAQAAAIHAGLVWRESGSTTAISKEKPAYVAVVKDMVLACAEVPSATQTIICHIQRELVTEQGAIYHMRLANEQLELLRARIILALRN